MIQPKCWKTYSKWTSQTQLPVKAEQGSGISSRASQKRSTWWPRLWCCLQGGEGAARAVHKTQRIGLNDTTKNLGNRAWNSLKAGKLLVQTWVQMAQSESTPVLLRQHQQILVHIWPSEHWTQTKDSFAVSGLGLAVCLEMTAIGRQSWNLFS